MNQQQNSEKTAVKRNQSINLSSSKETRVVTRTKIPINTTNNLFFFKNLDIKKQKLNKSYKQYCNQFMFDDYKRLTDVV